MKTNQGFRSIVVITVFVMAMLFGITVVEAAGAPCETRENNNSRKLLECVTLNGVLEHLAEFQVIADANSGTRASGTDGYDDSADYVASLLLAAGYNVTVQTFDFDAFRRLEPSALQQTAPVTVTYAEQTDYNVAEFSVPGDVTAPVTAVDLQLGGPPPYTSGCEEADFAGFPVGNIALIRRGTCAFRTKAENAANAGAAGAIIFNTGGSSDSLGIVPGTLTPGYTGGIPVFFATYNRGAEWAGIPGLVLRMDANVFRGTLTTSNIIAETLGGRDDQVVVVGAPLDSASFYLNSPGINNNGSGAAAILEIALQMKRVTPVNKVQFIWWGAEEDGGAGSNNYLINLTNEEFNNIMLYMNFSTIGSPNFVRFIYDGDNSIEAQFERSYAALGVPYKSTPILINAFPFALTSIPLGGLFTGTSGIKTTEEAALFGGTAGVPYDPCYRLACDTFSNLNLEVLDQNADAAAFAVIQNAMGLTSDKIKIKDKSNFSGLEVTGLEVK